MFLIMGRRSIHTPEPDGLRLVRRCSRCGHLFCNANENYKLYALHRSVHLKEIMPPLPTGEPYIGEYHEYFCPGCATQLQVDLFCPPLGGDPILWDTRIQ